MMTDSYPTTFEQNVKPEEVYCQSVSSPSTECTEIVEATLTEANELYTQLVKQNSQMSTEEALSTKSCSRKTSYEDECEDEEASEESELQGWDEKKDKVLKNLAAKCKYDWKKIAKKFNASEQSKLTPLELKQKYKDLTKVAIPLRVKFSHQEDLLIAKYFEVYGCDWNQIATHFTDRTAMMLKNRYYSHIRKRNLLSSMLDEVKEGVKEPKQVEEVESEEEEEEEEEVEVEEEIKEIKQVTVSHKKDEEMEAEGFQFFFNGPNGFDFKMIPMGNFNTFFEIENAFATDLHERITHFKF